MNNETPDREYKDDPDDFAQSSDLAVRGKTGEYAGGGVDTSSQSHSPAKGEQTWQKGTTDTEVALGTGAGVERADTATDPESR